MFTLTELAKMKENKTQITADYLDYTFTGTIVDFDDEYALIKVDTETEQWVPSHKIQVV